jgi:hypothetical protein
MTTTGTHALLVLGRSKSATNRSQSAFRSDGARGTWTENDRVDTRRCFPAMSLTITKEREL